MTLMWPIPRQKRWAEVREIGHIRINYAAPHPPASTLPGCVWPSFSMRRPVPEACRRSPASHRWQQPTLGTGSREQGADDKSKHSSVSGDC